MKRDLYLQTSDDYTVYRTIHPFSSFYYFLALQKLLEVKIEKGSVEGKKCLLASLRFEKGKLLV